MKNKLKIIILFSIFYFLFYLQASAASLNLVSPASEIGVGQQFQIDLMLDAEGKDINAVEGKVVFPENLLELKAIYTGNSIINFWVEPPAQKDGEIKFSGVIPGGFSGVLNPYYKEKKPGKVFSLIFNTKSEGSSVIEIRDAKVLLNDGKGTATQVQISNFQFLISNQILIPQIPTAETKDTDPPELFTPEVSRDPNIFGGKWFLVFTAPDKGSGIDYYVIHESARKKEATRINIKDWTVAESPYILKDQKLRSYIYMKAIDKAGNERFAVLPPKFALWYKKPLVYIIGGLIGLVVLLLVARWLWRKLKYRKSLI